MMVVRYFILPFNNLRLFISLSLSLLKRWKYRSFCPVFHFDLYHKNLSPKYPPIIINSKLMTQGKMGNFALLTNKIDNRNQPPVNMSMVKAEKVSAASASGSCVLLRPIPSSPTRKGKMIKILIRCPAVDRRKERTDLTNGRWLIIG